MMKKVTAYFLFLFVLTFLAGNVLAGSSSEIELKDGSVIRGEILSAGSGVYTVQSETLGVMTIEQSKIRNIRMEGNTGAVAESAGQAQSLAPQSGLSATGGMMEGVLQRLQSNPEVMAMISALQEDPDFQEILKDPALMSAVSSGDLSALLANPKFMKVLNNPAVQDIGKKLGQ